MEDFELFKQAVLEWTYNTLHSKFPSYFNTNDYYNTSDVKVINSPNVYWSDTVKDRPLDCTECILDIVSDDTQSTFGVDGEFYKDTTDNKYYTKMEEPHIVTVRFSVTSMKNEELNLTALQAQNLTYSACCYLRTILKSGSASDYFCYDNDIYTPILICSRFGNISDVNDTSDFEDTKNKHTNNFTCMFRFDVKTRRETDMAQKIGFSLEDDETGIAQDFEIELNENE